MKWSAKLITAENEKNRAAPVYWSLTNDEPGGLRIAIDVYKADRATLDAAKKQVKSLIKKLNS